MTTIPVDDELPPGPSTPAIIVPDRLCQFCKSKLTAAGEVLELSSTAKKYVKVDLTIESLEEKIVTLTRERDELRAKLVAITKTPSSSDLRL